MISTTCAVFVLIALKLRDDAKSEDGKFGVLFMDCMAMFWFVISAMFMVTGR